MPRTRVVDANPLLPKAKGTPVPEPLPPPKERGRFNGGSPYVPPPLRDSFVKVLHQPDAELRVRQNTSDFAGLTPLAPDVAGDATITPLALPTNDFLVKKRERQRLQRQRARNKL